MVINLKWKCKTFWKQSFIGLFSPFKTKRYQQIYIVHQNRYYNFFELHIVIYVEIHKGHGELVSIVGDCFILDSWVAENKFSSRSQIIISAIGVRNFAKNVKTGDMSINQWNK